MVRPIQPGSGITAGEGQGPYMSRAMVYDVLAQYHLRWGLVAPVRQWCDDLAAWMGDPPLG